MPLDPQALRATMRQWVTGVSVVTTIFEGAPAGMTVSSFTSVSLEPPTVLVCLNKNTYCHARIEKSGVYAVSLLMSEQAALANRFAGLEADVVDRFAGVAVTTAETGAPLLIGAVGWLDCVVRAKHDAYTHTIFIGEVVYAKGEPDYVPLVYYNRRYQNLTPQDS